MVGRFTFHAIVRLFRRDVPLLSSTPVTIADQAADVTRPSAPDPDRDSEGYPRRIVGRGSYVLVGRSRSCSLTFTPLTGVMCSGRLKGMTAGHNEQE
jgi:hypothetical protein